jgi:hypothetical protein
MMCCVSMSAGGFNGGGIVVFFRKWLNQYVEIVKCVADCMI